METTAIENPNISVKPSRVPWIILGIIVLLVIGIAFYLLPNRVAPKPAVYSMVKLTDGEIYFGKLNGSVLTDVYVIDQTASSTSLVPITSAFYQPESEMDFNPQSISFSQPLNQASPIVTTINKK